VESAGIDSARPAMSTSKKHNNDKETKQ